MWQRVQKRWNSRPSKTTNTTAQPVPGHYAIRLPYPRGPIEGSTGSINALQEKINPYYIPTVWGYVASDNLFHGFLIPTATTIVLTSHSLVTHLPATSLLMHTDIITGWGTINNLLPFDIAGQKQSLLLHWLSDWDFLGYLIASLYWLLNEYGVDGHLLPFSPIRWVLNYAKNGERKPASRVRFPN